MARLISLIERMLGKAAPAAEAPRPLPVISLDKKLRMVAVLLDHAGAVTVSCDDASLEAVALASSIADVLKRAGWFVTLGPLASDGANDVSIAFSDPFRLTPSELSLTTAWTIADLGPLRRTQGEPGSVPEFRISGRG